VLKHIGVARILVEIRIKGHVAVSAVAREIDVGTVVLIGVAAGNQRQMRRLAFQFGELLKERAREVKVPAKASPIRLPGILGIDPYRFVGRISGDNRFSAEVANAPIKIAFVAKGEPQALALRGRKRGRRERKAAASHHRGKPLQKGKILIGNFKRPPGNSADSLHFPARASLMG
jgi:hypothetical protein